LSSACSFLRPYSFGSSAIHRITVKCDYDRGKRRLSEVPWQTLDGEDWSDVVGHAYRRLDGRLALFPWQNRPDATQLDIALTYVVRLLADMLTTSDPRILNQSRILFIAHAIPIAYNE
jgi:hypothetical protein